MDDILKLQNVSLNYQSKTTETPALSGVSFNVKEGEFVSIIGPSGCGKTSILSLIDGLIKPSEGEILLNGKKVEKPSKDVGYMLQNDELFEWLTIQKNAELPLKVLKIKNKMTVEKVKNLLKKYGLDEFRKSYPYELSGGMRQRVALIRTLSSSPKLLLLDEPFSALDYQTRLTVCDDVYKIIKNEKKTAILVTHDISEAISVSDRIIVLSERPTKVKKIHDIKIDKNLSPLLRREHKDFSKWFEILWKELNYEKEK